ncbi:hypothetical protein [Streptomyces sp. NBC_01431]|nr:hypothetical protein [Streptomyces sp. NBC_01431]
MLSATAPLENPGQSPTVVAALRAIAGGLETDVLVRLRRKIA